MNIDLIYKSFAYVSSAPNFWGSMGFTVAIAMFAGAMIYDGQLNQTKKALFTVASYASMLLWITLTRVANSIEMLQIHPENTPMAFAGTTTIIAVTLSWIIGVFLGVIIFSVKYKNKDINI